MRGGMLQACAQDATVATCAVPDRDDLRVARASPPFLLNGPGAGRPRHAAPSALFEPRELRRYATAAVCRRIPLLPPPRLLPMHLRPRRKPLRPPLPHRNPPPSSRNSAATPSPAPSPPTATATSPSALEGEAWSCAACRPSASWKTSSTR